MYGCTAHMVSSQGFQDLLEVSPQRILLVNSLSQVFSFYQNLLLDIIANWPHNTLTLTKCSQVSRRQVTSKITSDKLEKLQTGKLKTNHLVYRGSQVEQRRDITKDKKLGRAIQWIFIGESHNNLKLTTDNFVQEIIKDLKDFVDLKDFCI